MSADYKGNGVEGIYQAATDFGAGVWALANSPAAVGLYQKPWSPAAFWETLMSRGR